MRRKVDKVRYEGMYVEERSVVLVLLFVAGLFLDARKKSSEVVLLPKLMGDL